MRRVAGGLIHASVVDTIAPGLDDQEGQIVALRRLAATALGCAGGERCSPPTAVRRRGPAARDDRWSRPPEACPPNADASPDDRASAVIGRGLTVIAAA